MKILKEASVYLVSEQQQSGLQRFLDDEGVSAWETDAVSHAEAAIETAGRLCYMSYGKGRKTNAAYMENILESKHGSVLEHAVWSFIFTGVSRSLTHELVRHRVGISYSQLSQRYVDESDTNFVMPPAVQVLPQEAQLGWELAVAESLTNYTDLVDVLTRQGCDRKQAREAARSLLPNATETKIYVTANGRALRHFLELRGSEYADAEIRALAIKVFYFMKAEAPELFRDFQAVTLSDGRQALRCQHTGV